VPCDQTAFRESGHAQPQEVAAAIADLARDEASGFIHGAILDVVGARTDI
jgi:NAD(P)-dependent dehydrogenase (short-subunit alcohol dehydrogenase family)